MKIGIIDEPLQFLYNTGAVIVISVYTSLPFAILPLYAVIEKFDFSLMEAARDLGATNGQAFFKIFIPNIKARNNNSNSIYFYSYTWILCCSKISWRNTSYYAGKYNSSAFDCY